ncbi:MAG: hypothetical protein CMF38_08220 [Legionellaceae bacterium]|nr:hypothetical protein [Legionellaceae bacterium]HCA89694.1 hypothetical protein [Legionellales bacterium]|tara:strand:+ start:2584 stop:3486 length:903 start_codon:yes stop_codon:yes gene_type:complete
MIYSLTQPARTAFCSFFRRASSVRVIAIDHDGCFGLPFMEPGDIEALHQPVVQHLLKDKQPEDFVADYVTVFSNRQDAYRDMLNAYHHQNNLAFPVAKTLAKLLKACFDPLLLADISQHHKPGFTINWMNHAARVDGLNLAHESAPNSFLVKQLNNISRRHSQLVFSTDKINILYAQTHRLALFHPRQIIYFHVYDDLKKEVLTPLMHFYQRFPQLIPANVYVVLHHFDTVTNHHQSPNSFLPVKFAAIKGQGNIDNQYYDTVNKMSEIACQVEGDQSQYHLHQYLTPSDLETTIEYGLH